MYAGLAERATADPLLIAVHGGTAYTRALLTERARLRHGLPALLVDETLDRDRAVTAVLSGRTDLVGASAATVSSWEVTA